MESVCVSRRRLRHDCSACQQGQALIYGLFVLTAGLATLFFLFNSGQLVSEKTKLVNASDAVAYSAGVLHARLLNFDAYANRAMIANTVAIAQLVSLSSWVQYVDSLAQFGAAAANPKFLPFYPSYTAALLSGPSAKMTLVDGGVLKGLATGSDMIIHKALMTAQWVAYQGITIARKNVMDEVAQANYSGDGTVAVDSLSEDEITSFVTRYSDEQRSRFAEVTKASVNREPFVPKRNWFLPGFWSDCPGATATGRIDWLDRRGGTELIGFDEWKAMDTLSEKRWVPKSKHDALCLSLVEAPDGWGSQSAADSPSFDMDPTKYGGSPGINPAASILTVVSSSDAWSYAGLPSFYDLSEAGLNQDDPRFRFAIRLRRDKGQTMTSEGRSAITHSGHVNAYQASPAGGNDLVAVSAAEVFYQRPDLDEACSDGNRMGRDNCYGRSALGKSRELSSLFNPYWQVRLIQSAEAVMSAQQEQGATLP